MTGITADPCQCHFSKAPRLAGTSMLKSFQMPAPVWKKLTVLDKYLMLVKCSKNGVVLKCVCEQGVFSHIILRFLHSATDEEGV